MQYVELGKISYRSDRSTRKRRLIKFGFIALLLSVTVYAGYVLYWPAATLLKQILKQPSSVFSLIKNPTGELDSTDGRTNFLLLGIDKREGNSASSFLTDTIVVASFNKETGEVAIVSVPRDLWVTVEPFNKVKKQSLKINAIYSFGDRNGYPGGGSQLIKKQVEDILGIPIHYFARLDFEGFKRGIDALGGIDVVVDKTFDDYQYPVDGNESANCGNGTYSCRFEHLHFEAGPTHMDGETALKFVRSRKGTNGEGSDFARAKRQQKVMIAAKEKALKLENLLDPIKSSNLFKEFGQSVETDLDISALTALYNLVKGMRINEVKTLVLDNSEDSYLYHPPEHQFGGVYVLLPKGGSWEKIHAAVEELLNLGSSETAKKDV